MSHIERIQDGEGNIIACCFCHSPKIRKDGFQYWKNNRKRQRWYCADCGKKTLVPEILEKAEFKLDDRPLDQMPIEDIVAYRKKRYAKKFEAKLRQKLIGVKVRIDGPVGVLHFGDPHIDDDGTSLAEIYSICDVINKTEGLFAGNLGDVQNNWIGRLQHLYGQQTTTARESWILTEDFLHKVPWMYLIAGNHDVWSGEGDPIDFIMTSQPGIYERYGARMERKFPNGNAVRINARHTFKGNSIWNTAHGVSRAAQTGWRDHVLTCGHTHVSGYQVLKDPSSGLISHAIQVASFKNMDSFAEKMGLDDKNIFNAPVTIIDPQYGDADRRFVTTIFDPHEAADFLTWKRSKK